ncbi:MAG: hypothetical protein EBS91_00260 [Betaproteobacteria bacterium]|nr:hypothetical protein [Betaproteobacteria bacterium]NCA23068.1 hypothetical protein [Betaproteobacteria bacterium]
MEPTTTAPAAKQVAGSDTYLQAGYSSFARYGARIIWHDGTTTCCGHSHKTDALAQKCLAEWLEELAADEF